MRGLEQAMLRQSRLWVAGCVMATLLASSAEKVSAQSAPPPTPAPASTSAPKPLSADTPKSGSAPLTAREQRDAQIEADTQRLYRLAQELKVEMDKTNKDTLSVTVIRKATEVEALAHSLKERLRTPPPN